MPSQYDYERFNKNHYFLIMSQDTNFQEFERLDLAVEAFTSWGSIIYRPENIELKIYIMKVSPSFYPHRIDEAEEIRETIYYYKIDFVRELVDMCY